MKTHPHENAENEALLPPPRQPDVHIHAPSASPPCTRPGLINDVLQIELESTELLRMCKQVRNVEAVRSAEFTLHDPSRLPDYFPHFLAKPEVRLSPCIRSFRHFHFGGCRSRTIIPMFFPVVAIKVGI